MDEGLVRLYQLDRVGHVRIRKMPKQMIGSWIYSSLIQILIVKVTNNFWHFAKNVFVSEFREK